MRNVIRDALSDAIREGIRRPSVVITHPNQGSPSLVETREIRGDQGRSGDIKGDLNGDRWRSHPDKAAPGLIEASVVDDDVDGAHVPNLPPE